MTHHLLCVFLVNACLTEGLASFERIGIVVKSSAIVKVSAWVSGDAKISAEQKKTFSKLEKELRAFEGILFEALNKRARVQGGVENAVDKLNEKMYNEGDDTRYSFAGEKAKTADLKRLAEAEKMLENGLPAEQIFKETGWLKGADGLWRFEITNDMSVSQYICKKIFDCRRTTK